jgi:Leucine-rich repeat (LRR) protein
MQSNKGNDELLGVVRKRDILLQNPIEKLRSVLGWFFLLVGVGLVAFFSTLRGRQEKACEDEFGACVWSRLEPKLYLKGGLLAGSMCGFGVDQHLNKDTWQLDVSRCGVEKFEEWRIEYADLEVLDLSNNELAELPGWLGQGNMTKMTKLKELRARGNKVGSFVDGMLGGENSTLVEVDLRDNEIVELPYEIMNVESKNTTLLFDGNPCTEEVDWSGLGMDKLPVRMMEEGYNNGNFSSSLRVLKLGRNSLDESVFARLVAVNFTNIEELDVSWNSLKGLPGDVLEKFEALRKLDVSGHSAGTQEE